MLKKIIVLFALLFLNCHSKSEKSVMVKKEPLPEINREFRAVWVATVANIDWPSAPGLDVEKQKQEALDIINRVKEANMNAIVLQVRPHCDAIYKSSYEPWSYYLTGEQGKAPEPYYDPLEFWITEAHKQGIEIHAWFNPYRAGHPANKGNIANNSIIKTKPNLVAKLASDGYYWLIPTIKEVQDYSANVVLDVVKNYDIDGVHFDDYFYPYPDYNKNADFPDEESYKEYKQKGGKLNKADWRRDAVNNFVKRIYKEIKEIKPYVKFGISPFGLYRPGYPKEAKNGFDQYTTLYADAKLWLNNGWIDYYSPQIYWLISNTKYSYPVLLKWWLGENSKNRNIFPGLFINPKYSINFISTEIINQIMVTRSLNPAAPGTILFSMKPLLKNYDSLAKPLINSVYSEQAITPTYPWLDKTPPNTPKVIKELVQDTLINLKITNTKGKKPFLYAIYQKKEGVWNYKILPVANSIFVVPKAEKYAVVAIDRLGNLSKPCFIE